MKFYYIVCWESRRHNMTCTRPYQVRTLFGAHESQQITEGPPAAFILMTLEPLCSHKWCCFGCHYLLRPKHPQTSVDFSTVQAFLEDRPGPSSQRYVCKSCFALVCFHTSTVGFWSPWMVFMLVQFDRLWQKDGCFIAGARSCIFLRQSNPQ